MLIIHSNNKLNLQVPIYYLEVTAILIYFTGRL